MARMPPGSTTKPWRRRASRATGGAATGTFLNFTAGRSITNAGALSLANGGLQDLAVKNFGAATHYVLDVLGYYEVGAGTSYVPITPCRAVDTRFAPGGQIGAGAAQCSRWRARRQEVSVVASDLSIGMLAYAGFQGLRVTYTAGFSAELHTPNSGVVVRPMRFRPACRILLVRKVSALARLPRIIKEPISCKRPFIVGPRSFMKKGTPAKGPAGFIPSFNICSTSCVLDGARTRMPGTFDNNAMS